MADLVANTSVKTPTALADMFIDAVAAEDQRLEDLGHRLRIGLAARVSDAGAALDRIIHRISLSLAARISYAERSLSALDVRIAAANPRKLLERGYTLVSGPSGALLKCAADANPGDKIRVFFPDGTLNCTVNGKV